METIKELNKKKIKKLQIKVRILLNEWDPLGVVDSKSEISGIDEYDCLNNIIVPLLLKKASEEEISSCIEKKLAEHFEIKKINSNLTKFVKQLLFLYNEDI